MIVRQRDLSIKDTSNIFRDKLKIVGSWLLEFRFSDQKTLAFLLGQKVKSTDRFFLNLEKKGIILKFENEYFPNRKFYTLSGNAAAYLETEFGLDTYGAPYRLSRLRLYYKIAHDLDLQWAILNKLSKVNEVFWERHIPSFEKMENGPDALVVTKEGYRAALEYERTRKSKKRIREKFYEVFKNLVKNRFDGAVFIFKEGSDKDLYKQIFDDVKISDPQMKKIGPFDEERFSLMKAMFVFDVLSKERLGVS